LSHESKWYFPVAPFDSILIFRRDGG
jgi:hypothetical protein